MVESRELKKFVNTSAAAAADAGPVAAAGESATAAVQEWIAPHRQQKKKPHQERQCCTSFLLKGVWTVHSELHVSLLAFPLAWREAYSRYSSRS